MSKNKIINGFFNNGLPFNQFGQGVRIVVVFQGLLFENKPLTGLSAFFLTGIYRFLNVDYRTYIVIRKPGLPEGYSMKNMSDDYADMIRKEFKEPVDIIGVSTGGSIAQHFAADHPDLVRRLVLHSSAFVLNDNARNVQIRVAHLARQRKWIAAYSALMGLSHPDNRGIITYLKKPLILFFSILGGLFDAPKNPSDLVVTIKAEDIHNFKNRLCEIKAPTLVIAGDKDPFYTESLFRETAEGISNSRLILYKGMGHPATGKQFGWDVLTFLRDGTYKPFK